MGIARTGLRSTRSGSHCGGIDAVVKAAAQYPIVTLTSHEPSLEDIFLRYYAGDGTATKEASHVAH